MKRFALVLTVFLSFLTAAYAQDEFEQKLDDKALADVQSQLKESKFTLSPEQLDAAIKFGLSHKAGQIPFTTVANPSFGYALQKSMLSNGKGPESGYRIAVLSPETWIALQASIAKAHYKGFTASDVTDEMKLPVLRVLVLPSVTNHVNDHGSDVEHIVIRKEKKAQEGDSVIQPLYISGYSLSTHNGFGGKDEYQGKVALFPFEQFSAFLGAGEPAITVVGTRWSKDVKIGKGEAKRLTIQK